MMKWVENKGGVIPNLFPLRTSIAPKYVRLDTKLLIQLLLPKDTDLGAPSCLLKDITGKKDQVWKRLFNLDRKCFAAGDKRFTFGHTIQTDGVGCSILWVEKIHHEKRMSMLEARKEARKTGVKRSKNDHHEPIRKPKVDYVEFKETTKNVVGVDPGKSDLIYCSGGEGKENWFRYTQNQRKYEGRSKKHRKMRSKLSMTLIESKTVEAWETELSLLNRKTLLLSTFKEYLVKKNDINSRLFAHYDQEIYRVLKWRGFINKKRSEDRMVNRFREKFGRKEDVILGWGDWSSGSHMKFHEPTKGIGMRKLFTRAGYEVLLVDEYRTSCRCYGCQGGECVKFKNVENPRPWRRQERPMILRHGLLSCTNCKRLWNRDRNGSLNIRSCAMMALRGEPRPLYMLRTNKISETKSVLTAQGEGLPTTAGVFI